ncbi:hypothetical protein NPIL_30931 [Nephila pilipes]|uniref:Uncharacterized protein n=1 Tax=Nephila pilipes TaxID=299642 RepID=A0A8X6M6E5_NEPPI|nr:hypothetical protein NPIL_30931 [Nephila pilipes]
MWFHLALNALAPSIAILVGTNGKLYVRLPDITRLLKVKNYVRFNKQFSSFFFLGKDVLPSHRSYPNQTLNVRLVTIEDFFHILDSENYVLSHHFLEAFNSGFAHKKGIRKIAYVLSKGPKLFLVDKPDVKSVLVPEWIRQFVLDVRKVREEEVKALTNRTQSLLVEKPKTLFRQTAEKKVSTSSERILPVRDTVIVSPLQTRVKPKEESLDSFEENNFSNEFGVVPKKEPQDSFEPNDFSRVLPKQEPLFDSFETIDSQNSQPMDTNTVPLINSLEMTSIHISQPMDSNETMDSNNSQPIDPVEAKDSNNSEPTNFVQAIDSNLIKSTNSDGRIALSTSVLMKMFKVIPSQTVESTGSISMRGFTAPIHGSQLMIPTPGDLIIMYPNIPQNVWIMQSSLPNLYSVVGNIQL